MTPSMAPAWLSVGILMAWVGGLFFVRLIRANGGFGWALPQCGLRRWTGLPCPACGSTRSLYAWSDWHLLDAFRFNPLFFLGTLALLGWAFFSILDRWTGTRIVDWCSRRMVPWISTRVVLVLMALNWIYLWLTLPM